jgi:adenosylcobyric acid synthase
VEDSIRVTSGLRAEFANELSSLPRWKVFPSDANFLLVRLPSEWPASRLQRDLLQAGILIRSCANVPGLGDGYCRLAVRPREEIGEFMQTVRALVAPDYAGARRAPRARRTPAIMVVGTMSNSGKSVIAAGLCRLFARRGYAVAPFKAQNMALNSYVTKEGGEMGRAQVVQARAAGVSPHTDMNPVLLKPLGERGSQVIVHGHAIGNFTAREYYAMKGSMRAEAHAAYDRLAAQHELIILEGAGSPAEINLAAEDFVNMDMAAHADASAVLVADIDRGGVFASILGTVHLLPPQHRRLLKGIIINKFRGDESLLASGIRDIETMTGVPVLGVLPYLRDLRIEAEDSLHLEGHAEMQDAPATLHVAVARLPRISNFTDFLALERTRGVRVTYPSKPGDMESADLIIIPGTKNTLADMRYLRESGWDLALGEARRAGVPLIGICGGYQMLGTAISDPHGVEGAAGEERGLGLLPVETTLAAEKELAQVAGITAACAPFVLPGTPFEGYEIHAGRTSAGETGLPLEITRRRGAAVSELAGAISADGLVFGCYIHGFFDSGGIRTQMLEWLCRRKGVEMPAGGFELTGSSDEFGRVADAIEKHVDLRPLEDAAAAARQR